MKMAKGDRRKRILAEKQRKKGEKYLEGRGESRYARKRRWLDREGKWGWEVPEPKPWGER